MQLTKYKVVPKPTSVQTKPKGKKPKPPEEDGTRVQATAFFNKFSVDVRGKLLNATVLLKSTEGIASAVILGIDDTKAYILTAKHNLFTLAGQQKPEDKITKAFKKPNEYTLADYGSGGIKITYGPPELLKAPANTFVQVSGFNFAGVADSGDTWTFDAMLFECTNPTFKTFVNNNRFIKKANYEQHKTQFDLVKGAYPLLDRKLKHIQLGYGKPKGVNMDIDTSNYSDYEGKIQCKQSLPSYSTIAPVTLYEPSTQVRDRSKWSSMSQAIELEADNTNSTAPGDSGGPLFAVKVPKTGDPEIYLTGVTSGANYYADEERLESPPTDRVINNNVATYWHEIFKFCTFLDRT